MKNKHIDFFIPEDLISENLKLFVDFNSKATYNNKKLLIDEAVKKSRPVVEKKPKLVDMKSLKNKGKTGQLF